MKPGNTKLHRAQAFAELAGVTVRALHHYDRLGLLKPSHRDLAQLEQIVVLKFLVLPLQSIGKLLMAEPGSLPGDSSVHHQGDEGVIPGLTRGPNSTRQAPHSRALGFLSRLATSTGLPCLVVSEDTDLMASNQDS